MSKNGVEAYDRRVHPMPDAVWDYIKQANEQQLEDMVAVISNTDKIYIPNWFTTAHMDGIDPQPSDTYSFTEFCRWTRDMSEANIQSETFRALWMEFCEDCDGRELDDQTYDD